MARPVSSIALISLLVAAVAAAVPARAQFDSIFGNNPPRPPGNVPSRPPLDAPPPSDRLPPGPPPNQRIQSQPLPPPPGSAALPQQIQPLPAPPGAQAPVAIRPALPGLPPGVRQPPGTPQPANTSPQPGDEVIVEPPAQKVPNPTAVFSGLDKITGRIMPFEVAINETVRFGALEVTPRACYTRPPTEAPNTDGFIEVDELTLQGELRRIFNGWMFVASPGLNAVEHPIYDVWLTDCKGAAAPAVAEAVDVAPAPAPTPRQQRPQQQQPQRRVTAPAPAAPAPAPGLQLPPPPAR